MSRRDERDTVRQRISSDPAPRVSVFPDEAATVFGSATSIVHGLVDELIRPGRNPAVYGQPNLWAPRRPHPAHPAAAGTIERRKA
ncbi:hypothetical protein ACIBBE_45545 [Streptomyces sp. NPDC051644]|uniref:hypothetical protein n=1 Tax=Streptomyces sp. NPDC051644 TaxID=3365666 RepID=UPI0037B54199